MSRQAVSEKSAYFDTCVYSEIDKGATGQVSPQDVAALQAALARKDVVVRVSLADIDELVGELERN